MSDLRELAVSAAGSALNRAFKDGSEIGPAVVDAVIAVLAEGVEEAREAVRREAFSDSPSERYLDPAVDLLIAAARALGYQDGHTSDFDGVWSRVDAEMPRDPPSRPAA